MQSDAASRPQDQADFETWLRHDCLSDLWLAARLMRHPLGRRSCQPKRCIK
jgi:hypothetical protein